MKQWFLSATLVLLTACSSSENVPPPKMPTTVTFSLVSDRHVNPNVWGEASPVEIQVFELTDESMFMSAGYDQIRDDYEKALKSNFVKNYDYVLTPGHFKFVNAIELDKETRYIGVMAHFADPELSEWKKAVKVLNLGREYHLLMQFKDYEVRLDRVE
ncbi:MULTISPECIES: type VI secretion system lipoprotein TssJ [Vibrio]|uniref:Type VI secretion system lipoprotein TssJ n=1 Tax=Vibrio diazotrophicus TaxID=685 RepID=A0A2J8HLH2_VIBDI|nr:type VI secretion system lipoprotein TssJ [Vibrio diazotrophicus]MCZ4371682.1 type VI secretion system lipoprotein TssJ [Vibrio diazotrophicus]PNH99111.1 type VI secretion system lipoprotein TssJ [Vibrio diazotrophicus]PNI06918.1 type VI secretion system lipoprotein TssJ [Vibrio diazotrophicus]